MFKKYIPFAVAENIYEIDVSFFIKHNVKTLLCDLDNTLDSFRLLKPLGHAFELKERLQKHGINMVVISNNRGPRVSSYANALEVPYINSARKPFAGKILKFIKDNNLNKDEVMFIGDQMITDVKAAYRAGIKVVLCNKLVKEDQWTTHINRIFGRFIRRYHEKHHNLINWRDK